MSCDGSLSVFSREIAEQAEEYEELMEKRLETYRLSVKKQNSRKRRREEGMYVCICIYICAVLYEAQ